MPRRKSGIVVGGILKRGGQHTHLWELYKQESLPMFTCHNTYKCQCGAEKENWELLGKYYETLEDLIDNKIN